MQRKVDRKLAIPVLLPGLALIALLAPLPYLGNLRIAYKPCLIFTTAATVLLYIGVWSFERWKIDPSRGMILAVALALRLAMLPMAPSLSDDVYRYLWDGRLLLHGISPYARIPADSTLRAFHDELFRRQGYPTTNTIYPPGAQLIFAGSMALGEFSGHGYRAGYILFKSLLVAAELIAIMLLLVLLDALDIPLRRALLYAWHPLVVVELAGQGHTDALWVLSLALAFFFYRKGSPGRGMAALAFGTSVRLFPLVLMPLWIRFMSRREVAVGLVLSVPFILLFLPFLDPALRDNYSTMLVRFTNYYEFNGGIYYAVKCLADWLGAQPSNAVAGRVVTALQLVAFLGIGLYPVRDRSMPALLRRTMLVITVQIVLTAKVHVWYFAGPLFLLPLLDGRWLHRAWLWASLVAPFTYLMYTTTPNRERFDIVGIEWGGFLMLALYDLLKEKDRLPAGQADGRS